MKVAYICPYFGTLPKFIQLWLNSFSTNKEATVFLLTDDKQSLRYPDNFVVKYMTIDDFRNDIQAKFDFPISLTGIYKIGDYKPTLGYVYEDMINGFDAWAYLDVSDEIMGDLSDFVNEELINKYDKLMARGHMSIYKNSYENNRRFMDDSGEAFNYKDILSSDKFYNFEEIAPGSIAKIYRKNGYPMSLMSDAVADLSGIYYGFRRDSIKDDLTYFCEDKDVSIYSRENGKVFGYFVRGDHLVKKEYLYVHFKRRKMELNVPLDAQNFLITPKGFEPYQEVDLDLVKKLGKGKLFYYMYFKEIENSIKRRLHLSKR